MSGRRRFGRIRKLPSGRWQARYRGPDGRDRAAREPFATKTDADRWLATVEADMLRGSWIDELAGKVRLATYAQTWLTRRSDLRPTTRAKYAHLLDRHVLPVLGSTELGGLVPSAVRGWYMALRTRHPVTADDAYRLLRAVLNTATADEMIVRNPCQVKGAGQVRSPERPTASVAEVTAAVEATPQRYRLALLLSAWCQLRRGEVLALQRRDVDEVHRTIRVERAWTTPHGQRPVLGPPKTEAGIRTLALPPNLLPALTEHLARFVKPDGQAWLFSTSNDTALSPRNFNRVWSAAREAAGRPDLRLHDLRHSGLTWAAANGATVAELMRRGGHVSATAALRYQHATDDRDRAIAEAMAKLSEPAVVLPLAVAEGRLSNREGARKGHAGPRDSSRTRSSGARKRR